MVLAWFRGVMGQGNAPSSGHEEDEEETRDVVMNDGAPPPGRSEPTKNEVHPYAADTEERNVQLLDRATAAANGNQQIIADDDDDYSSSVVEDVADDDDDKFKEQPQSLTPYFNVKDELLEKVQQEANEERPMNKITMDPVVIKEKNLESSSVTPIQLENTCTTSTNTQETGNTQGEGKYIEEEEEEEEENDYEQGPTTLADVKNALEDIHYSGVTCTGEEASALPLPGLLVDGAGDVPLPLTDVYARLLEKVAQRTSSLDHGPLEIEPSLVRIQNPAWETGIKNLMEKAKFYLGVHSRVRVELCKLLLFDSGSISEQQRIVERKEGLFATLMVQLPSRFTGGSYLVSHKGNKQEFTLGAGEQAAFGFHYVCHYADCEHEILPIESGNRLALLYSLCYTGLDDKPSPEKKIASVLGRLPPDKSLFVCPLEHLYTVKSLSCLGAGALKGIDRAKEKAIRNSGEKGGWQTVIANMSFPETNLGSVTTVFQKDGSEYTSVRWMKKSIDFKSFENDGMVLASQGDLFKICEDVENSNAKNTGTEHEKLYTVCVLIVFSVKSEFESLCEHSFSECIVQVERNPQLLNSLLQLLGRKSLKISYIDSAALISILVSKKLNAENIEKHLRTILGNVDSTVMPTSDLSNAILPLVRTYGWSQTTSPCRNFLMERLNQCKHLSIGTFLGNYDLFLPFKTIQGPDFVFASLRKLTNIFAEESLEPSLSTSQLDSDGTASCAADILIGMIHQYGWKEMKPVAQLCFSRLRKSSYMRSEGQRSQKRRPENLVDRLIALNKLSSIQDLVGLRREVVKDFIAEIEEAGQSVLSVDNLEILVRGLCEHMTESYYERIENWAARASLDELGKLDSAFKTVTKEGPPRLFNAGLVERCAATIHNQWKKLHLEKLRVLETTLLCATQCGEPSFSWYMLSAKTPNKALTDFLRGPRCGPEIIIVGGNANYARGLATFNSKEHDCIKRGYSAHIFAMGASGENTAIRVTKTKAYSHAIVEKYRSAKEMLDKVQSSIREQGGTILKNEAVAPAPKRRRTKSIDMDA